MRLFVALALMFMLSVPGCGDAAPEELGEPDTAEAELSDDELEAEEGMSVDDGRSSDPDALDP